jgi:sigma-B regulation protein RsbU (phosphoserine phosphatase)
VSFDQSAGELFVLCSDGVFEAFDPEGREFGADRLLEVVAAHRNETAQQVVDAIFDAVTAFRGDRPQSDDLTAVAVRITA